MDKTKIDLGLDINTIIVNIKSVSLWWYLYVISKTWAIFGAMSLKKSVAYKKASFSVKFTTDRILPKIKSFI